MITKASKKISNECRDVQHTGLKAHKPEGILVSKVHKQGALGTSSQASLHQWLHRMSNNQGIFFNLL